MQNSVQYELNLAWVSVRAKLNAKHLHSIAKVNTEANLNLACGSHGTQRYNESYWLLSQCSATYRSLDTYL